MLGAGALVLFLPATPGQPALSLVVGLAIVFTGFSALQILFYASGVAYGQQLPGGHERIAGWREAGVLTGVAVACVLPEAASAVIGRKAAFGLFAVAFAALLGLALWQMRGRWPRRQATGGERAALRACWRDAALRRLLGIGLLNALPTGLTATLFLFFVEDRLEAPGHAGPALLAFFVAAAAAAPAWARAARRFGPKRALLAGMAAAIAIFLVAATLGSGDWPAFYLIAIGSGAAMGADMTLLPALLARRLDALGQDGAIAFGLWGFVNKAALALAAGLAMPALDVAGYQPGPGNSAASLTALALAYAAAPSVIKAAALVALAATPLEREATRC